MLGRKKKNELDYENLNDVVALVKKILKVLFSILILGIIFISVIICKELKIMNTITNVLSVASPFFIGIIIAWILDPLVSFLQRKKINRTLGSLFVFFIFILLAYLMFKVLIPMLYTQINEFVDLLPSLFKTLSDFVNNMFSKFGNMGIDLSTIENNLYSSIQNISINLTTKIPTYTLDFIKGFVSSIGILLLGLVVGFYLLIDFKNIKHALDFVPKKYHKTISDICYELNTTFKSFIQGTLTISIFITIISFVLYRIIGLKSALLLAIICGITNIIPYIGPWIGGTICVIIGFSTSTLTGILAAVMAFAIQEIDSIVLHPLIMGKAMKLHPVTIMVGLLIFGYFFGVVGMIFATPIMAGLKIILTYFDNKYELRSKLINKENEES